MLRLYASDGNPGQNDAGSKRDQQSSDDLQPPRSPDHTISPTYRAIGTIVRLAEVRAATSNLLTMLSNGTLTPPAIVRYSLKDFQEAVRRADGEAGQQKVLLDFSERAT